MFCYQCEMSSPNGCGSTGASVGTCGKDENLARLQDIMVFGLKGLSAYREHLNELEPTQTKRLDDVMSETLYFTLTNVNFNFDNHINQLMKVGSAGVEVMDKLSNAHTSKFGIPTPVTVSQNRVEGKAILVSGHNLEMFEALLKATEGKGINVYTHSEMLPAHGYPELRKYSHLKGNVGKAWFDQADVMKTFPGTFVVNTNCIVPPKSNCGYLDRLFTYKIVGVEGSTPIEENDFSALIERTLQCDDADGWDAVTTLNTGHHYKTILTLAPQILEAIRSGKISQFFVIAGCDAPGSAGNYYREMAENLPNDCVIITSSCGKFRFNDIDFGNIQGTDIPRYLDLGQCNDSNGAVEIAKAISNALNTPINDLPIAIVLSWMEQKAVIILLALFSLGIKDIYLGPKPPQFVNEDIYHFLAQTFNLHLTGNAQEDLENLLIKKVL
ncbi:MAG: hydroxylamine reductase [Epsilonproteobacteria bacterium]|nr:hydroxylamine reductase [Campylobacterota bacterium]OIO15968.1 MAG: hydroxylamine reductase [Helicobacteraceae bacterium CG1_02_36_14]PIP10594.1 MAG: hydroxylamine reductase [Sulfurimonas sp. CG23_combo_of_CG06-09_8_20_14_all_36_33]PIS24326.1 MAG: hydroxylamine reductase [Sulfurimonas sp. CG08_land_8_20_14_0_20_36_33]PIU36258.1 MAG: hydroxylamine reductase [Sulfurimonas sp. CG07_land_8_20_14_0_80_36_56]PIV04277.1 MAG: hydroxylamine reductase [Sulfurimonas sp. CG03_land_8_20_14_0_80_36_25]P